MATFIAMVRTDDDLGFTASFPDFSGCVVAASTLDRVLAKAKETLVEHLENLLSANQAIGVATSADAIERGDALLLAAIEVPDDVRTVNIELAIPALSLVQIDSFARRHGLSRDALFVQAVGRWAAQETLPIERRGRMPEGPTLFDFGNPLELKVEAMAAESDSFDEENRDEENPDEENRDEGEGDRKPEAIDRCNTDEITAELQRLLEQSTKPEPISGAVQGAQRPTPEVK
jgi:predicted RNase H-like HicB family nuclease